MTQINTYRSNAKTMPADVKRYSEELLEEIQKALNNVEGWGSVEIFIQDFSVTQITVRKIKKTKHVLAE